MEYLPMKASQSEKTSKKDGTDPVPDSAPPKVTRYDPSAIIQFQYANLVVGHFRNMPTDYRIVRASGTQDWLIILGISGCGVMRTRREERTIRPNQIVLFRPETPHDYGTDARTGHWELIWAHFHCPSSWLSLLDWPEELPGVLTLDLGRRSATGRRIVDAFRETHRLATGSLPRRDWLAMNAMEGMLLHCDAFANKTENREAMRLETALQHIRGHLSEPIELRTLADIAKLSVSQFSLLFRQHMKTSPMDYVESLRMDLAARLLRFASVSVKEAALKCGYDDQLYFSKRFRQRYGVPPSEFRG